MTFNWNARANLLNWKGGRVGRCASWGEGGGVIHYVGKGDKERGEIG